MRAWTSRDHGQRPMLLMLVSSMAMTAMRCDGSREVACTPRSYALRSRLGISSLKRLKRSTAMTTTAPRDQSDLRNPDFMPPPPAPYDHIILKNSGLTAIFAVKCKLRQIFRPSEGVAGG